jgi:hypothetical protein
MRSERGMSTVAVALDFASAYDSVDREILLKILKAEGLPKNTIKIIKALMTDTQATVRVGNLSTDKFGIDRGVKQGSVLSPTLFIILMDWVLREALDGKVVGLRMKDRDEITDLVYADDVLLLSESVKEAQLAINKIQETGRKVGLILNAKKTVWIANGVTEDILTVENADIPKSSVLVYLGSAVNACGGMENEVDRRISAGNASFWAYRNLWKNKSISVQIKMRIYSAVVRSRLLYASQSWALTGKEKMKLEVWDRNKIRYVTGVWPQKISNQELMELAQIPQIDSVIKRSKWKWLGSVLRMDESRWPLKVISTVPNDNGEGKRTRGAPKKNWLDTIIKEGWETIDWAKIEVRKPHWKRWREGVWLETLSSIAHDSVKWRLLLHSGLL